MGYLVVPQSLLLSELWSRVREHVEQRVGSQQDADQWQDYTVLLGIHSLREVVGSAAGRAEIGAWLTACDPACWARPGGPGRAGKGTTR